MTKLARYQAERFPARVWLPIGVVLWLVAAVLAAPADVLESALRAGVLGCALLSLRIWDDLADLPRDRLSHPERVLVRARSRLPWGLAASGVGLAAVGAAIALPSGGFSASILLGLGALLAAWYGVLRRRAGRFANAVVVLVKYPLLPLVVAGPVSALLAFGVLCPVYLLALAYEALHDPTTLEPA